MTVQELINELNKVQDKTKDVSFSYDFGTNEMGKPLTVIDVTETRDIRKENKNYDRRRD